MGSRKDTGQNWLSSLRHVCKPVTVIKSAGWMMVRSLLSMSQYLWTMSTKFDLWMPCTTIVILGMLLETWYRVFTSLCHSARWICSWQIANYAMMLKSFWYWTLTHIEYVVASLATCSIVNLRLVQYIALAVWKKYRPNRSSESSTTCNTLNKTLAGCWSDVCSRCCDMDRLCLRHLAETREETSRCQSQLDKLSK